MVKTKNESPIIINLMFPQIRISTHATPHARGVAVGQASRAQVGHSVATYARQFAACGIDWAQARRLAQRYLPAIEALDASLLDEMRGLAEGSRFSFEDILTLNCRTEILPPNYFSGEPTAAEAALKANRAAGIPDWADDVYALPQLPSDLSECTAMCVNGQASADGHAWFSQNWDWIGRQRAALVVVYSVDANGTSFTTLAEGGMLAKIGMNQHGLAIGLNILRSVRDGAEPGVPVHILLRHLLSLPNMVAARERLSFIQSQLGFGAASNIPCADALGEVGCFEVAPAGWAEQRPHEGVVVHTNHFLCESLLTQQAMMSQYLSSEPRLATAAQHAAQKPLGLSSLQAFLRDESGEFLAVCRRPNPDLPPEARVESVAGIIMHPHTRRLWIAPDVPTKTEFQLV
jgi:isopenicillin-N N-acyltransferase-like protein